MNPELETRTPAPSTTGWSQSALALISSRVGVFQIELQQALRERSRSFAALIAAVICFFFTWALGLTAGIATISFMTGWPWHIVAWGAAALHLLTALALLRAARAPKSPAFPVTRSEFQKDREWIESIQKNNASKS